MVKKVNLTIILLFLFTSIFAFNVYNKTDHVIYAEAVGGVSDWQFGFIQPNQYSDNPWEASKKTNLPAQIIVSFSKDDNANCNYQDAPNATQHKQRGSVLVEGSCAAGITKVTTDLDW